MTKWIAIPAVIAFNLTLCGAATGQELPRPDIAPPPPPTPGGQAPQQDLVEPDITDRAPATDLTDPLSSDRCNRTNLHCVWVAPNWFQSGTRFGQTLINILNTGGSPASVTCYFLDGSGDLAADPRRFRLSSGARRACRPPQDGDYFANGWILIAADNPVFPDGRLVIKEIRDFDSRSPIPQTQGIMMRAMTFYPINCANSTGTQFACEFVKARGF